MNLRSRLHSLKAHAPDLLSLGVFVGLPSWLGPAWKGYHAARKLTSGETEPTLGELQEQIREMRERIRHLEELTIPR